MKRIGAGLLALAAVSLGGCEHVLGDRAAETVRTADKVAQCEGLRLAIGGVMPDLQNLSGEQLERIGEINAVYAVACAADLAALADEARAMREASTWRR